MKQPFFSIIVVSLNAEKIIKTTIKSILKQSFTDYEIIVKDGCSTDNTLKNIPESDKIKVFQKADKGIYDAMNQAIDLTCGKYICFMNCGDIYPDSSVLQAIYNATEGAGDAYRVIYGDYQRNGIVLRAPVKLNDFHLYRKPLNHQSMYIGKDVFIRHGYYDTSYKIMADYEHTVKTYKQGVPYVYCDCIACDYMADGVSESPKGEKIKRIEYKLITKKHFSKFQLFKYRIIIFLSLKKLRGLVASDHSPLFLRKLYFKTVNAINRRNLY